MHLFNSHYIHDTCRSHFPNVTYVHVRVKYTCAYIHVDSILQYFCTFMAQPVSMMSFLQVFYYIEDAPLLLILDDFIQDLDQLLVTYEKGTGNGRVGGGDVIDKESDDVVYDSEMEECKEEECLAVDVRGNVDGHYVALLEMRCLLQQRVNDVQHHWWTIYHTFKAIGSSSNDYAGKKITQFNTMHVPNMSTMHVPNVSCLLPKVWPSFLPLLPSYFTSPPPLPEFALEHRCRLQPSLSFLISHVCDLMQKVASVEPPRLIKLATHLKITDKVLGEWSYLCIHEGFSWYMYIKTHCFVNVGKESSGLHLLAKLWSPLFKGEYVLSAYCCVHAYIYTCTHTYTHTRTHRCTLGLAKVLQWPLMQQHLPEWLVEKCVSTSYIVDY